jgi:hypothetical protein
MQLDHSNTPEYLEKLGKTPPFAICTTAAFPKVSTGIARYFFKKILVSAARAFVPFAASDVDKARAPVSLTSSECALGKERTTSERTRFLVTSGSVYNNCLLKYSV